MAAESDVGEPVAALVRELEEEPGITAAYLFGSRARGDADGESDLDVGVLYRQKPELIRAMLQRVQPLPLGSVEEFRAQPNMVAAGEWAS